MWMWLLTMVLQIALLGRQLHCVVLLADLETDIQNPHDWAREMNRFRVRGMPGRAHRPSAASFLPRARPRSALPRATPSTPSPNTHHHHHHHHHNNNNKQNRPPNTSANLSSPSSSYHTAGGSLAPATPCSPPLSSTASAI